MKVIFDLGVPTERGTTIAVFDYASALVSNPSYQFSFIFNETGDLQEGKALHKFRLLCDVIPYRNSVSRENVVREQNADVLYQLSSKKNDFQRIPGVFSAHHITFSYVNPAGDASAYVSEWLANFSSGKLLPYVPHIVDLPEVASNFRREYNISDDLIVIGRHGGFDQFDIPFVKVAVEKILFERSDILFLFVNTKKFIHHSRALFIDPIHSRQGISDYITSCDMMLHARRRGETFGLAVAEFFSRRKRVLCWGGGWERNHLFLQVRRDDIYYTHDHLIRKLRSLKKVDFLDSEIDFPHRFTPSAVTPVFEDVFLSGRCTLSRVPTIKKIRRNLEYQCRKLEDRLLVNFPQSY